MRKFALFLAILLVLVMAGCARTRSSIEFDALGEEAGRAGNTLPWLLPVP